MLIIPETVRGENTICGFSMLGSEAALDQFSINLGQGSAFRLSKERA